MIADAVLIRTNEKIAQYIKEHVNLAKPEKKEEVLELFDNMCRLFPQWVIATCATLHPDIHYITGNARAIFGYNEEYLIKNSRLDKYLQHVHNTDVEDVYDCMKRMQEFIEGVPPEDHHLYRFIFHYRYQKGNGQYIYFHDERATLNLQQENLYFAMFRDITTEKSFSGVKMEVFRHGPVMEKVKEYKPSAEKNSLSKRESELVTLIRQGLSMKEIAGYLKISPNTARNIKSKLFEKYNVSNSIELLNMIA